MRNSLQSRGGLLHVHFPLRVHDERHCELIDRGRIPRQICRRVKLVGLKALDDALIHPHANLALHQLTIADVLLKLFLVG